MTKNNNIMCYSQNIIFRKTYRVNDLSSKYGTSKYLKKYAYYEQNGQEIKN